LIQDLLISSNTASLLLYQNHYSGLLSISREVSATGAGQSLYLQL
jgi:hypothetical protein